MSVICLSYLVALAENSEPIWINNMINMGIFDGIKSLTSNKSVTWDRTKTSIESARVVVSAYSETSFGSAQMIIYMNGQEVLVKFWDFNEPHIETVDVTGLLQNGLNVFVVTYEKNPIITLEAHLTITATLEFTFTGEDQDAGDDWWANVADWIKNNPLVIAGIGMGVVGGIILAYKRKR